MSVQELLGKVLADKHADVLRQAVVWLAQELMEAEVTAAAGAGYGERSGDRLTRRNGYRERTWDTRVGSIELAIPRLRSGSYFPSFLEPRRRSEKALVAVVQEAYVNGVSTRKVDRLVEPSAWRACPRTRCRDSAKVWTSRSARSGSGRPRPATPPSAAGCTLAPRAEPVRVARPGYAERIALLTPIGPFSRKCLQRRVLSPEGGGLLGPLSHCAPAPIVRAALPMLSYF
jgi:Transposase, Mutator family